MKAFLADRLTAREKQVVTCLSFGRTNKEIATKLGISEQTVKNHFQSVFRKHHLYGAGSRLHLALQVHGARI